MFNVRGLIASAGLLALGTAPVFAEGNTFQANDSTVYRITTQALGPGMALDVLDNGSGDRVHLDGTSPGAAGQLWHIHQESDGTFVVTTAAAGACKHLDLAIHPGGISQVLLNTESGSITQHWQITQGHNSNEWRFENKGVPSNQSMQAVSKGSDQVVQMAPRHAMPAQRFEITPEFNLRAFTIQRCDQ